MQKELVSSNELQKILKNPSPNTLHPVYYKVKGRRKKRMKKKKNKYTLDQIGDALFSLIARIDYIVKANDLKDLPKNKSPR